MVALGAEGEQNVWLLISVLSSARTGLRHQQCNKARPVFFPCTATGISWTSLPRDIKRQHCKKVDQFSRRGKQQTCLTAAMQSSAQKRGLSRGWARGGAWSTGLPPDLQTPEGTPRLQKEHRVRSIRLISNKYFSTFNQSSIFLERLLRGTDRGKNSKELTFYFLLDFYIFQARGIFVKIKWGKPNRQGTVRDKHLFKGPKHQYSHCL